MKTINKLISFLAQLKEQSLGITIETCKTKHLDQVNTSSIEEWRKFIRFTARKARQFLERDLTDAEIVLYGLTSSSLKWIRPEQFSREGYLVGRFSFISIRDVFFTSYPFYEKSVKKFLKYESEDHIDYDLLNEVKLVESSSPVLAATYSPYYGCAKLKEKSFPDEFYFYDSGLIYLLNTIKSYSDYIEALVGTASVECWQYFYIEPKIIIKKNKSLNYITWELHSDTSLDESLRSLELNPNAQFDRLDLINEYLERCVRLLPKSFPFLDFSYHINWYQNFKELYEKSKNS